MQQGYPQPAYPPQGYGYPPDPSTQGFAPPPMGGYPPQQYGYAAPPQSGYGLSQGGYAQQGYQQPQKKALLVGISYAGTDAQVEGTHEDVDAVYAYLTRSGYAPENILVLTDKSNMQGLNRGFEDLSRGDVSNAYAPPYGEGAEDSDSDSSDSDSDDGQAAGGYERGGGKKGKKGKGKKDKKGKSGKKGKKGKGKKGKSSSNSTHLVNNNTALGQYINTLAPIGIGLFNHFTAGHGGSSSGGSGGGLGGLGSAMSLAATLLPLKNNIMSGMQWLTGNSRSGDTLFFHYSGHGAQNRSRDAYSFSECLLPLDHKSSGVISDEELHASLIARVPEGVKLISLVDCCGSGNGMELPYIAEARGTRPGRGELKSSRRLKGSKENTFRSSPGMTICISSVQEGDTSGYQYGGQYSGKLTHAFLDVMQRHSSGISYEELIFQMREVAGASRGGFQQTPAVAFNVNVDLYQPFLV